MGKGSECWYKIIGQRGKLKRLKVVCGGNEEVEEELFGIWVCCADHFVDFDSTERWGVAKEWKGV